MTFFFFFSLNRCLPPLIGVTFFCVWKIHFEFSVFLSFSFLFFSLFSFFNFPRFFADEKTKKVF